MPRAAPVRQGRQGSLPAGRLGRRGVKLAGYCPALPVLIFLAIGAGVQPSSDVALHIGVSDACAAGKPVVAKYAACWNASSSPWYPAQVTATDEAVGELTIAYGWADERWSPPLTISATAASSFSCLAAWPRGDAGRGFAYLPPGCSESPCTFGCRAVPLGSCAQGDTLRFGEMCTVLCSGTDVPTVPNLTCSATAPLLARSSVCKPPIVYCDDAVSEGGAAAANASSGCVARFTSTTTTTTTRLLEERLLRGCSELRAMREGVLSADPSLPPLPVGMPDVQLVGGAYYYEVVLEGPFEQVGWVDGAWTGTNATEDALHSFMSAPGGPGIVGAALRITGKGVGDFWFSRDGVWEGGRAPKYPKAAFQPPLVPAAALRGRATWVLPYSSWTYFPPSVIYKPVTSRPYPVDCRFPHDFETFARPPACGPGFERIEDGGICEAAAFHAGLEDWTAKRGYFPGWPTGCFFCSVCDLEGGLYLNNASQNDSELAGLFTYTANQTSLVCRRVEGAPTTTVTTTTATEIYTTTVLPPLYMTFGTGVCGPGYLPIRTKADCEVAARTLALRDSVAANVSLGAGGGGLVFWPPGCFYCPTCDVGNLFLNEAPVPANATPPSGSTILADAVCRARPEILTTGAPTTTIQVSTTVPLTTRPPSTTTFVYGTSSVRATTTSLGGRLLLTCSNPYTIAPLAPWWQRIDIIAGAAAAFVLCCCCPCACWCCGVSDFVAQRAEIFIEKHPRLKNSRCFRVAVLCGRCCWRACPCIRALGQTSPRSPRKDPPPAGEQHLQRGKTGDFHRSKTGDFAPGSSLRSSRTRDLERGRGPRKSRTKAFEEERGGKRPGKAEEKKDVEEERESSSGSWKASQRNSLGSISADFSTSDKESGSSGSGDGFSGSDSASGSGSRSRSGSGSESASLSGEFSSDDGEGKGAEESFGTSLA